MSQTRINSIDVVRGLVILLMPLDHVRDLLHIDSLSQSPTDLSTTTPILFFSRWITHFCAPVFVFLAGTSAQRYLSKQADISFARKYLFKRGLYLMLLEFLIVNLLLYFDPGFHILLFEVIATIGFGFICLGLLIKFKPKTMALIGLLIVFLHNLLPLISFAESSILKLILNPFFGPAVVPLFGRTLIIAYPPIPWLGIMMIGFAAGKLYEQPQIERVRYLKCFGLISVILFFVLRGINLYGDPVMWTTNSQTIFTVLSFLNLTKYPPSLLFTLMTLGPMLLCLAYMEKTRNKFTEVASVFGRVPLFFFLAHFLLIHLLLIVVLLAQGFAWPALEFSTGTFGRPKNAVSGISLPYVIILWLTVLVILYPICRWFGKVNQAHQSRWIKYI